MTQHIGVKIINAYSMDRLSYNDLRGWELPGNENGSDEGYLVEYLDGGKPNTDRFNGYVSWSPKDVFDKAYRPVSGLSFGLAVEALKLGKRVTRTGWNGKGQYVILIPGDHLARSAGYGFGEAIGEFSFGSVMALKNAQNIMQPGWVPSQGDVLADDWKIL